MPYQPIFPSPYLETVDVNNDNTFKCVINPKDRIMKYELKIYSDSGGTLCLTVRGELQPDLESWKKYCKVGTSGTEYEVEKSLGDTDIPIYGSYTDKSWLQCVVPASFTKIVDGTDLATGLTNGTEYSWEMVLYNYFSKYCETNCTVYYCKSSYGNGDDLVPIGSAHYYLHDGSNVVLGYNELGFDGGSNRKSNTYYIKYNDKYYTLLYGSHTNTGGATGVNDYIIHLSFNDAHVAPADSELTTNGSTKYKGYSIGELLLGSDVPVVVYNTPAITTPKYYFKCGSNPEITMNIPATITQNTYMFTADYYQDESIEINYYKFDLYLNNSLVKSTDEIYSSDIRFEYSGLLNNSNYSVVLTVETAEGVVTEITKNFYTNYENAEVFSLPTISQNSDDFCVELSIGNNVNINGILNSEEPVSYTKYKNNSEATAPVDNNAASLDYLQNIYWNKANDNPLNFDNTTTVLHWHGHNVFLGDIFEIIDEATDLLTIKVGYENSRFYYKYGMSDSVEFNPYLYSAGAIQHSGETVTMDYDTEYLLNDSDELVDTDTIISNYLPNEYWWYIVITPSEVHFIKGEKFSDTEVVS